jgi:peptidoglycan/LPS O-acetylase OafA/YrhL
MGLTEPTASPAETSAAVSGRIPQLDGLRAVAILLVLVNHTFRVPLTWAGVDVFFVLSGFLITGILLSRKHRHPRDYFGYFYGRRAFRILPSYYLTLLIFGLLFGWSTFHPWPLLTFFGMNLQFLFTRYTSPLPLWSLAVEEQFYLVFPVIVLLCSERLLKRLLIAALVLTPLLRILCKPLIHGEILMYTLTPFRADLLCAGALLAMAWKSRTQEFEEFCRRRMRWVLVGTVFVLGLSQHWHRFTLWSQTREAYTVVFGCTLIGSVALVSWALADRGWLRRVLTLGPMMFLGQISYTMYLVHIIVEFLLERHGVRQNGARHDWVLFCGTLAGSVAWATLSWFAMERPLIRFAARRMHGGERLKA